VTLTRAKLEQICDSLYKRLNTPFQNCVQDSGFSTSQIDDLVLVGGMTRSPKVVDCAHSLIGKAPHQGVNPDEVVAVGACVQGGVLRGEVRDILLLDVTPLTLGIETAGAVSTPMIDRNTTIPTKKTQIFSTYADNQSAVDIKILHGERPMSADNKMLGTFRLDGIPSAPRGTPQIEVTFDIDANGILHVTAKDLGTGKDQKITISGSSGLSQEEIERLKKEAELHQEEDKKRKEAVEARNQLDNIIYQGTKELAEYGDKVSAEQKNSVEALMAEGKKLLEDQQTPTETLKAKAEEIAKALYPITAAHMAEKFKSSSSESPEAHANPSKPQDDNVVDADFEVIDDEDNKKN